MATVVVLNSWAGVSDVQQEGFRVARKKAGKNAQIFVCLNPECTWWGWTPTAHYNPNGSGAKHLHETCFAPERLGLSYILVPRSSKSEF